MNEDTDCPFDPAEQTNERLDPLPLSTSHNDNDGSVTIERGANSVEIRPSDIPLAIRTLAKHGGDTSGVLIEAWNEGHDRMDRYGRPEPNMKATARLWDAYIKNRLQEIGLLVPDEPVIRVTDVPQMMISLKQARFQTGEPDRDHFVDEAGYARVTADVLDERGEL